MFLYCNARERSRRVKAQLPEISHFTFWFSNLVQKAQKVNYFYLILNLL